MKLRKGWYVVWPDGTEWFGNCPKWAAGTLMRGARLVPVRVLSNGKTACPLCVHGVH